MPAQRAASHRRDSVLDANKYPPLNDLAKQIRICRIEPGPEDSRLVATLRTADLEDVQGNYVAISYPWGNKGRRKPITLNGYQHRVRLNLHTLLLRLRAFNRGEALWIDAVCINQHDGREKNEQVKQMPHIFSGAKDTMIVLEETVTQDVGSKTVVKAIIDDLAQGKHKGKHLDQLNCFNPDHADAKEASALRSFHRLLKSKWFTRLWTIQEICLSENTNVLFSWGTMPWKLLVEAFEGWNEHRTDCCEGIAERLDEKTMNACYDVYLHIMSIEHTRKHRQQQSLLQHILTFQHLDVSDEKDTYWALSGLHPHPERLPALDYNQEAPAVFVEVVKWILDDTKSLKLLALELHGKLELPSWVPDFAGDSGMNPNYQRSRFTFLNHYNSSAGLEWSVGYPSPNVLALQGVMLYRIQDTSRPMRGFPGSPEHASTLREWCNFVNLGDITRNSDDFDAFAATMIAECAANNNYRGIRRADDSDFEDWKGVLRRLIQGSFVEGDTTWSGLIFSHVTAVLNRRLFRTVSGRLGVGPHRIRSGDSVWLFGRSPAPLVLRRTCKTQCARSEYALIGHCYLHGAMRGEAVPQPPEYWRCHLT